MYTVVVNHQNGSQISEMEIHTDYYRAPHKKLQSATLELEENTAGTFTFTVPKGQIGNDGNLDIDIKSDEVLVFQNPDVHPEAPTGRGKEIWRGFFLENNTEFFNSKTFTCIGELAYLNETVQKDATYKFEGDNEYPEKVFKALLKVHNDKVPEKKRFLPGTVTVKADNTAAHLVNKVQTDEFYTTYSDHTFDCIKKLIDSCGGYLKIRRENDTRYLDWLTAYEPNGQTINFGKNLLDYAVEQDVTDLITVLYPFGESVSQEVDDGQGGTTTKRVKVNISTATGQNGRMYVTLNDTDTGSYSQDPMTELGWREGTVDFPNVRDPDNLRRLAINYLKNQWDPDLKLYTKIQIKAVDLAYFTDEDADPIEFLQSVKVTSTPHGITNKVVPVTKMTIPLLQPEQTIYTMSTAMRKTKQISTSVTDHDKDIEKTQETVDEIGGGGGNEDEGEDKEIITGKDPSDDWVIGKVTIGKKASVSAGEEFMPHADHLKLFYDRNGSSSASIAASAQSQCYFVRSTDSDTGNNEIVINGKVVAHYNDTGFHPYAYGLKHITIQGEVIEQTWPYHTEQAFSAWTPSYISEELVDYDDLESHAVEGVEAGITYQSDNKAFAGLCDGLKMKIYWTGPTRRLYVNQSNNSKYMPMRTPMLTWHAVDMVCSLRYSRTMYWQNLLYCPDPSYNDDPHDLYFNSPVTTKYHTDIAPPLDGRIKVKSNTDDSRYTNSKVFGSWASGIMPMAERPLFAGALDSLVVYCVCDFVFGEADGGYLPGLSTDIGTNSLSIYHPPITVPSSDESAAAFSYDRLCNYSRSRSSPVTYKPVALYPIEKVASQSSSASDPFFIRPRGHMYAYAWIRNVGAGEKYPFTSELTGGLVLAVSNGAVYTGQTKWTAEYNNRCSQNSVGWKQAAHMSQLPRPSSNPKSQYLVINHALDPYTATSGDYATDDFGQTFFYADPYNTNNPRLGGFGSRLPPGTGGSYDPALWRSSMAVNAIGYAHAAYNQITMDEVVDNLNYLISKYGK